MDEIVPRKTLVKQFSKGAGGVGGGIALWVLSGLGGLGSLIVGGLIAVVGLAISTSEDDRTAGLITTGAGALTMVTAVPFLGGLAGALMSISGIALLIGGGYNLFQFFRGMKNRR